MMKDYRGASLVSPTGGYAIFATVNRTDRDRPDYAFVVIHLLDPEGKELQVYRSRAGDASKWALGWMPDADVVILQSSDVGSMAFEISEDHLKEISPLNEVMKSRAKILKAEKYATQNKAAATDR
jgi:hypothetical protein